VAEVVSHDNLKINLPALQSKVSSVFIFSFSNQISKIAFLALLVAMPTNADPFSFSCRLRVKPLGFRIKYDFKWQIFGSLDTFPEREILIMILKRAKN